LAKFVTLTEIAPHNGISFAQQGVLLPGHVSLDVNAHGIVDYDVFASIYNLGKMALLISWKDAKVADSRTPGKTDAVGTMRHRNIRIVRDYGRFDRHEAPQYYAVVKGQETKHPAPTHNAAATAKCDARTWRKPAQNEVQDTAETRPKPQRCTDGRRKGAKHVRTRLQSGRDCWYLRAKHLQGHR
jgi:ribosomal protein L19E